MVIKNNSELMIQPYIEEMAHDIELNNFISNPYNDTAVYSPVEMHNFNK